MQAMQLERIARGWTALTSVFTWTAAVVVCGVQRLGSHDLHGIVGGTTSFWAVDDFRCANRSATRSPHPR